MNNASNLNGSVGTWTSSNPAVIDIDQNGVATAFSPGTANVHFTSPSGVVFSEWTMYVVAFDPCGCLGGAYPF